MPTCEDPALLICSTDGCWWTGSGWADRVEQALRFDAPRRAYLDAHAAWLKLRRLRPCVIVHIPAATTRSPRPTGPTARCRAEGPRPPQQASPAGAAATTPRSGRRQRGA